MCPGSPLSEARQAAQTAQVVQTYANTCADTLSACSVIFVPKTLTEFWCKNWTALQGTTGKLVYTQSSRSIGTRHWMLGWMGHYRTSTILLQLHLPMFEIVLAIGAAYENICSAQLFVELLGTRNIIELHLPLIPHCYRLAKMSVVDHGTPFFDLFSLRVI